MIEGPGHVPMNQIEANIQLQKRLCHGAPFYVLGPAGPTDIAPGYDHITGAIGGAIAARAGRLSLLRNSFRNLRLPTVDDVREGVIASRIAGHAADIAREEPGKRLPGREHCLMTGPGGIA